MNQLTKEASVLCNTLEHPDMSKSEDLFITEMVSNGYKLTVRGADLFLDNCDLPSDADAHYRAIAIRCLMNGKLEN